MSIIFQNWNEQQISFTEGKTAIAKYTVPSGYVNATQMCQANGKRWHDYRRLDATTEYWQELSCDTGIPVSQLAITIASRGQDGQQGTWVHPEIAIDLGVWISPKFRVWVNRQIKNILNGSTPQPPEKPRYYIGMVQEDPKKWDEHFNEEFRYHAQRLTGWDWNWRCMSGFINRTVYNYFPREVREELNRVNPCDRNGYRANKQHQHLTVEEELRAHINQVLIIMRISTSRCTFFDAMQANFYGSLQQELFK